MIVPTHYLLLENLLCDYKPLIINTPRKPKQPKETNWKQKFQKPQNENICLTYLNTENNGNFHFLSFEVWSWWSQNRVEISLFTMGTSFVKMLTCLSKEAPKWTFQVAFYSIFKENTHEFLTFSG